MESSREKNIKEAIAKYGPITDRFILRLGKSEEEAGKFESWHSGPSTAEEDFQGFLACLRLTRLVDSVEERMKSQKGTIRAVKKEQRETAKALAREQEKLQKAIAKAAAKVEKEAEKQRIKAEAKAERERLKAEKKLGKLMPVTTAIAKMLNVETGEDLPEGATPRTDDTVFLGGGTCTSTSTISTPQKANLWTVGFYEPTGDFVSEGDYKSPRDAAARVNYLNGGSGVPIAN